MNFKSDNIVGIHPQIMESILAANQGSEPSYGNDSYSQRLQEKFSEVFETQVSVYLTSTGTAANSLALSALTPPFGAIYCHDHAHINTDECGAPELFAHGAKLVPIQGLHGKLQAPAIKEHISAARALRPHISYPSTISISQATEFGTIYRLDELQALAELATCYGLNMHMDGARFTNSLVTLGCTPAEASWKAGIDVMSFGATKNGAMAAEAIVFFNQALAQDFDYRHKRGGQLISKARFFACQFLAYFENDLWLKNAQHANKMALLLAGIFKSQGYTLAHLVEANELFVQLSKKVAAYLTGKGGGFYEWGGPDSGLYRFVTSCFTSEAELDILDSCLKQMPKL